VTDLLMLFDGHWWLFVVIGCHW